MNKTGARKIALVWNFEWIIKNSEEIPSISVIVFSCGLMTHGMVPDIWVDLNPTDSGDISRIPD